LETSQSIRNKEIVATIKRMDNSAKSIEDKKSGEQNSTTQIKLQGSST
jgi:hypothetical protein